MKNKSTVVIGYLILIPLILGTIFSVFVLIQDYDSRYPYDFEYYFFLALAYIYVYLMLIYLIKTRFWKENVSGFYKLEQENKIIKKQIEKRELEIKLSELNK